MEMHNFEFFDSGLLFKIDRKKDFINTIDPIITKACNLCCPHCWGNNGETEFLSFENYEKILNLAKYLKINTIQYTGGEPLLHHKVIEFAKKSKEEYFNNRLRTNFATKILDKTDMLKILEYFDSVYISIDGTAEDNFLLRPSRQFVKLEQMDKQKALNLFKKYAEENFNVIKTNLDNLVKFKKEFNFKTKVIIATVIQKYNLEKIEKLLYFINKYDNIRWDVTQITLDKNNVNNITNDEFISKIRSILKYSNNIVKIKTTSSPRCLKVDNEGQVLLSDDKNFLIGNCLDQNIDNFKKIKDKISKNTDNSNPYYNYLYIPVNKIQNLLNL